MAAPSPKYTIERNHFTKLTTEFVNRMENIPTFIDNAMKVNLLGREHKNEIMSSQNVDNQIRKILEFVETKLPSKSNEFLEALIKSENDYLAQKLIPETSISDLQKIFNVESKSSAIKLQNKYQIENFTKSLVDFVDYMSDMPTFIDYALQINLLNKQNKNEIMSVENVDNQTRKMWGIMERKLPEKSDEFLYALTKSGNDYLIDLLVPDVTGELDFTHITFDKPVTTKPQEPDNYYPMKNRGRVVIIENVEFFDPEKNRHGSEKDRKALESFFKKLNFEIIVKRNLTAENMEKELQEEIYNEKGYSEDCFILFILSHGRKFEISGIDGKTMSYSVIYEKFNNCPIWNDTPKPKLIYIQACQPDQEEPDAQNFSTQIPPDEHFYIMYATIPGKLAYRNTKTGSRLIQSLIKVYEKSYLTEDVETMGIKIRRMIYRIPGSEELQIAVCYSCIPMKVYLGPA